MQNYDVHAAEVERRVLEMLRGPNCPSLILVACVTTQSVKSLAAEFEAAGFHTETMLTTSDAYCVEEDHIRANNTRVIVGNKSVFLTGGWHYWLETAAVFGTWTMAEMNAFILSRLISKGQPCWLKYHAQRGGQLTTWLEGTGAE